MRIEINANYSEFDLEELEYLLIQILNRKLQLKKPIFEMVKLSKEDLNELDKINKIEEKLIKIMKK